VATLKLKTRFPSEAYKQLLIRKFNNSFGVCNSAKKEMAKVFDIFRCSKLVLVGRGFELR
jgi:hypothetical protein